MISNDELDRLLQDWAVRHELQAARAEAIRGAARPSAAPRELSARWWKELFAAGIAQPLRQSTDLRPFYAR